MRIIFPAGNIFRKSSAGKTKIAPGERIKDLLLKKNRIFWNFLLATYAEKDYNIASISDKEKKV